MVISRRCLIVTVLPLPHRNVMPQTQDMTPHHVTVYRHGADMSLCYLLMWNVTLEYTTTHFNVLGQTRSGNPSPTFHTQQRKLNFMMVVFSQKCAVPTGSWTRDLWYANPLLTQLLLLIRCTLHWCLSYINCSKKYGILLLPWISVHIPSSYSHGFYMF